MKKKFLLLIMILPLFLVILSMSVMAEGPPPPPPGHSLNGNQASPGGTGCPIDRNQGVMGAMVICMLYAGYTLFRRGQRKETAGEV